MADGTPWKHDLSHDSTISLWVAGAVMNMARLPKNEVTFYCEKFSSSTKFETSLYMNCSCWLVIQSGKKVSDSFALFEVKLVLFRCNFGYVKVLPHS